MTKLEELKAARAAAIDAAVDAYNAAVYAAVDADDTWVAYSDARAAARVAYEDADAAYYDELKKIQEEKYNGFQDGH
jgi:hypothetical protein